ncbi:lipase class 3 [Fusarium beomiforme]|uniref:Lipase class 3 n=1 Tax=Fusarium beomiforme TaxID=44412 RepID=A0A9P5ASX7_9HYPO|nr:lipase class 3 [Fusarium beomiforme]
MAFWLFGNPKPRKSKKPKKGSKPTTKVKTTASTKPKITDPPNVFRPAIAQTEQPMFPGHLGNARPNTAAPRPSLPYTHHNAAHSQPHFQPAGYLPAPANWNGQPLVINNHYHLGSQQSYPNLSTYAPAHHLAPANPHQTLSSSLNRFTGSMVNLAKESLPPHLYDDGLSAWHGCTQIAQSTNALYDRFNDIMTLIDHEKLKGNDNMLFNCAVPVQETKADQVDKGVGKVRKDKKSCNVAASVVSGNYFSKVEQYANSKLPSTLPPLALYVFPSKLQFSTNRSRHMPTWPLLCLAAQYSQRVYEKPRGTERDAHVSSDFLAGPRQTCIKSVSMDDMNTIVFAIRGTASFMDWAVNLNSAPMSPLNFLDDPGNLCHAGFLSVAKKMVRPVAARLRQLLQEDPKRSTFSLLITGHSAGGAIAALLYSHMVAETNTARSELNVLTSSFKRIHCVTFGAPPVSLLPLTKPDAHSLRKSIFLSFVNEGDPVVRADKAYVKSLLDLLASPPPSQRKDQKKPGKKPTWKVPPCTLSNAGRIVVLRSGDLDAKPKDRKTVRERLDEGVVAVTCSDERLRSVIWGDPVCHLMSLYAARIEVLAVRSVTARH